MDNAEKKAEIERMREVLARAKGKHYWRGIEELSGTEEFRAWLDDEFPGRASIPDVDRRSFFKLMGASLALAGLAGCRNLPQEKILPYVKNPVERYPGEILQYATAMPFDGYGFGLLATSNEGRPTKLEGNPDHPASLGSTDVFSQAEILELYDPDRTQVPIRQGNEPSSWEAFMSEARAVMHTQREAKGQGLLIVTETVTSPTLYAVLQALRKDFPLAKWYQYNPVNRDNEKLGSQLAFGEIVDPQYDFSKAELVLSLDCDIFACRPRWVRHTRDFMTTRDPDGPSMSRLYVVESTFSGAGLYADHRLPVKPSEIEGVARYIASRVGAEAMPGEVPSGRAAAWVDKMIADLQAHRGSSLVVAGEHQPPMVHALAHAINHALGNEGKTVSYSEPVEAEPTINNDQLAQFAKDLKGVLVDAVLIFGSNLIYSAPADLQIRENLQKLPVMKAHFALHEDETTPLCDWHLPLSHFLESWGDVRSYDGTVSIVQPLIEPLFDSKSVIEVLSSLMFDPGANSNYPQDGYELVRSTWAQKLGEKGWRDALNKGVVPGTAAAAKTPTLKTGFSQQRTAFQSGQTEAVLLPDPTIYDGRYNNNGWLQELPKPMSKLSWDNAVLISPATAQKLGVEYQDNLDISAKGGVVSAPCYVLPGHPDDVLTLHLGYGREATGKVGTGTGFNFGRLRTSADGSFFPVRVSKGTGSYDLATSQTHHSMDGRHIVREGTLDEYKQNPSLEEPEDKVDDTAILYNLSREWATDPQNQVNQWGMTIDLNSCTGCGACEIACQAENNIVAVGKDQVQRGRIMHWIRVDRYFTVVDNGEERDFHEPISQVEAINPNWDQGANDPQNVRAVCMPVPCMQCETAPCEPVCPVAATVHSHEGLNQMVYNRCVGTRYCSNNCPYKVRRFNFYNYQMRNANFSDPQDIPLLKMINNPDVTVRSRGVMEKCSYCVQRINRVRIQSKVAERDIRDGEIVPACAQACPTKAITFGDISKSDWAVAKLKAKARNYSLLGDLNTRPRTTYLGKVRNANKEMPV